MKRSSAAAASAKTGRDDWQNFLAVWACAWAAVAITHIGLLRLPYYWDEAGYYIPAAFDFFRFHTLVPVSTLSNAHPPLPSIFLAACWRIFGFHPLVTRLAVTAIAALGLAAVYRIARLLLPGPSGACAVAALTLLYPVWFAQSTLAHADIFAAAATLCGLAVLLQSPPSSLFIGMFFSVAALSKETAIITPLSLLAWLLWRGVRGDRPSNFSRQVLALLSPVVLLGAWYAYHWHRTGFIFGNPKFLRYNAIGTLHFSRVLYAAWLRAWHVTGHMNLWVAALLSLSLWLLPAPRETGLTVERVRAREVLVLVFAANLIAFSILGGAILTRYLLPLYPLVILFHVGFWQSRTKLWPLASFVTGIAFVAGSLFDPPYQFAAEDNLSYASAIRVEQQAISRVLKSGNNPTVLTTWPLSDYLSRPELGYVSAPVRVAVLKDFSLDELQAARRQSFDEALLFYQLSPPPSGLAARWFPHTQHHEFNQPNDLPPALAARLLGGEIDWQTLQRRHYAAVVRMDLPVDAQAPASPTFIMSAR